MWAVDLIFAYTRNPLRLIRRRITAQPSQGRAAQHAHYMRRLAAKDQRGTLTVGPAMLHTCPN